ncbi:MAG TPA: outer membrane protein assembly factor BamA [Methylomirabilota bacterium]|nr:outer membrane protein assembly factor BamA [Methylomirabilota bacterium]
MATQGRSFLSIFFALLLLAGAGAASAQAPRPPERPILVKEVAVQGNRRVQEAVILGRAQSKVGTPFLPTRVAEDIRAIFALGFFDDVQAKTEDFEGGIKLTFVVVERPFIRDIVFAGSKKFDAADLQQKIDLKLGSVYNPVEANRAADKLKEFYEEEGYFEVSVTPDVEKLPDGDVTVVFRIAEGRRITIDEIQIVGAQGLKPKAIKAIMLTQERQYFILRGTVQRQKLDEDLERIVHFYNDHGYIQARVETSAVQIDRARARATIKIVVVEGQQFRVGGLDVTGNAVLPVEEIRRRILLKSGDVYSRSLLGDSLRGIRDLYGTVGRASAEVNPSITQDLAGLKVNVAFEINEGPEVFIERINISGNTRSEEKILRRELPMEEGELFTTSKLARAKQKLTNLNYFDKVDATTAPGSSKDKIVVNIQVTEKPTGLFSIGGGYSSQDGVIGTLDLSQRNFLGKGWEVFLRIRGGANAQYGQVGFTEPWLFDRPLAAGFDLYKNLRDYTDYKVDSTGGDVRFGHPLGDYSRVNLLYRASADKIADVAPTASQNLLDQEGTHLTSLVGLGLSRDTRDSLYETTKGSVASIGLDFAGVGFGEKFFRTVATSSYFHPIWLDHVLSFRVLGGYALGWAENPVPLFERFQLGGASTLRQFKAFQVSPKDSSGTRIGGNVELLGNMEYTVPLIFGMRAAAFLDVGQVWGPDIASGSKIDLGDLRWGAGLGFRWTSPFGPIRLDYGIKLDRKKGESFGEFQFSAGSAF